MKLIILKLVLKLNDKILRKILYLRELILQIKNKICN